jgi:hypothetical protein
MVSAAILQQGGWLISSTLITASAPTCGRKERWTAAPGLPCSPFLVSVFILADLFDPDEKDTWRPGLILIAVSAVLFLLLGGKKYLPWPQLSAFSPLAIALIGLIYILVGLSRKKKDS